MADSVVKNQHSVHATPAWNAFSLSLHLYDMCYPTENKAHLFPESSLNSHHPTPRIFNPRELLNITISTTHSAHVTVSSYLKGIHAARGIGDTSLKKIGTVPGFTELTV